MVKVVVERWMCVWIANEVFFFCCYSFSGFFSEANYRGMSGESLRGFLDKEAILKMSRYEKAVAKRF